MSEVPLGMAGHHAGPRVRRVASDPASAASLIIAAVVSEIVPLNDGDARDASVHKGGPTIVPLCALHVLYAGALVKTLFRRRTGDNGTYGLGQQPQKSRSRNRQFRSVPEAV
jgi:hypothetical protein